MLAKTLSQRDGSTTLPAASARPDVLGAAFKLTPAELRVLLAIVELGSVSEVAAAFGLGDATIRTHVSHVFEKTGAKRQADLVKLVTGICDAARRLSSE